MKRLQIECYDLITFQKKTFQINYAASGVTKTKLDGFIMSYNSIYNTQLDVVKAKYIDPVETPIYPEEG